MANSLLECQTQINNLTYGDQMWCSRGVALALLQKIVPPEQLRLWHDGVMQREAGRVEIVEVVEVCQEAIARLIAASEKAKSLEVWASGKELPVPVQNQRRLVNEALKHLFGAFQAFEVVDTDPVLKKKHDEPRQLVLEYLILVVRATCQLMQIASPNLELWVAFVEDGLEQSGLKDFIFDTGEMYMNQPKVVFFNVSANGMDWIRRY